MAGKVTSLYSRVEYPGMGICGAIFVVFLGI